MEKYRWWDIYEKMPEGWRIDETCGSPLAHHVFIVYGKSPITGQKRALLKLSNQDTIDKQMTK